jgi:hypothetical protein
MRSLSVSAALVCVVLCAATSARADIVGFNGLSGWRYNTSDSGSPPVIVDSNQVQLTTGPNNTRSIWFEVPQSITSFEARFTYRASSIAASGPRQGVAFVIQNDPAGPNALGTGGSSLGYGGITASAAVTIETDTGPGLTYSGFYTNGVMGGGSAVTTPVNAFNFRDIDVIINYSGSILSVTMVDGTDVYGPQNHLVGSLASVVGGPTAYVGFTAATFNTLGSGGGANQFLSDVSFTVPSPGAWSAVMVAGCMVGRRRRH